MSKKETKTYTGRKHEPLKARPRGRVQDIQASIYRPNCPARLNSNEIDDVDERIRHLLKQGMSVDEVAKQEFRGDREKLDNHYVDGHGMVTEVVDNPRFAAFRERVAGMGTETHSPRSNG